LKQEITRLLTNLGAFKIGIADPAKGFTHAMNGCHPLDVMKDCRSVIVYGFNIGLDYYSALDYEHNNIRLGHLYRDWAGLQLITFLKRKTHDAVEVPREHIDEKNKIAPLSFKLAAYEAGIGTFGRPSIIITPEYGPRINLGVILTDAYLEPSGRIKSFNPCENCYVCVKACPMKAIGSDVPPPTGFDRDRCVSFIDWLRKETRDKVKLCGFCYNTCPAGKLVKKTIKTTRWTTFADLTMNRRKKMTDKFTKSA